MNYIRDLPATIFKFLLMAVIPISFVSITVFAASYTTALNIARDDLDAAASMVSARVRNSDADALNTGGTSNAEWILSLPLNSTLNSGSTSVRSELENVFNDGQSVINNTNIKTRLPFVTVSYMNVLLDSGGLAIDTDNNTYFGSSNTLVLTKTITARSFLNWLNFEYTVHSYVSSTMTETLLPDVGHTEYRIGKEFID